MMEANGYGYENTRVIVNEGQGKQSVNRWHANIFCVLSVVLTFCIRVILTKIGKPNFVKPNVEFYKWRNIFISWIHALIVGPWAFLCMWWYPKQLEDPVFYMNSCLYTLVPVSVGYFVADLIDIVITRKFSEDWGIKIHHIFIITGMPYCWNSNACVSYCAIALLGEINSIFLHFRKLLQFTNIGFDSLLYRTVSMLSLITFVVFRILPQIRCLMAFYIDYHRVPKDVYIVLVTLFPPGVLINIGLFWQLVQSDILDSSFGLRRQKKNKLG